MRKNDYQSEGNTRQGLDNKSQESKGHIKPCTIILVEDDQDNRMLAMYKFKKSELIKDVVAVSDGEKLVEYMADQGYYDHSIIRYNPMVIVIDLQMPNMNGFDVLKEIKLDSFLKEIPVIVLSGMKTDESILKAFKLGADSYLTKPLELKRLESLLYLGWQWPPQEIWN